MPRKWRPRAEITRVSDRPHWLVVEDMQHRVLSSRLLPPGTDLLGVFLEALLDYHQRGWALNEFTSMHAHFYASRADEKHYVQITIDDPAVPKVQRGMYG
jgi:hypothetical protein